MFIKLYSTYKNLITDNKSWIIFTSRLALAFSLSGFILTSVLFITSPDLVVSILDLIAQGFEEILPVEDLGLNFATAKAIFLQNTQASMIALFAGIFFGIIPFLVLFLNMMIIGFFFALVLAGSIPPDVFLISVVPHGIVEIPVFILAVAFGMRFGFSFLENKDLPVFSRFKKSFRENIYLAPLIITLLALAALIETYITGYLVQLLG